MKADEMKNLKEIEIKILMLKGRVKIRKLWNDLVENEMNKLEAKVNAEIQTLEKKENKVRKIMKDIEKSESELEELEIIKTADVLLKKVKDKKLEEQQMNKTAEVLVKEIK